VTTDIQLLRSSVADKRPEPTGLLEGQPAVNWNSQSPGLFFRQTDNNLFKVGPATITTDGSTPNAAPLGHIGNCIGEEWWDARTVLHAPVLKLYRSDVLGWQTASGFTLDDTTGDMSLDRKLTLRTMVANGTGADSYIQIPAGPTSDQTLIGALGMMRVETDNDWLTYHDGTDWKTVQNKYDDAEFANLVVTGNTTLGDDCTDALNIVATTNIFCDTTLSAAAAYFEAAGTGSNRIGFQAPAVVTDPVTLFTLPDGDGAAGTVLGTDGAGNLEWVDRTSVPQDAEAEDTEIIYDDNDVLRGTPLLRINRLTPSISINANLIPDNTGTTNLGSATSTFGELHTTSLQSTAANVTVSANILPGTDNTLDLGSATQRFANLYTGDLHLKNDRGDWTMIEEEDHLTLRNNKTGKVFRLLMEEVS